MYTQNPDLNMYIQQPILISDRNLVLPPPNNYDYTPLEKDCAQYSSPTATRIDKAETPRASPIDKQAKKQPGRKSMQNQETMNMSDAEKKAYQNRMNQARFREKQKEKIEMMEEELQRSKEATAFYSKKSQHLEQQMNQHNQQMEHMHRNNEELRMANCKLLRELDYYNSPYYNPNIHRV